MSNETLIGRRVRCRVGPHGDGTITGQTIGRFCSVQWDDEPERHALIDLTLSNWELLSYKITMPDSSG